MRAFLLAAGLGTRLRPITETKPKCLVEIQGKPLLQWWLELLEKHGITEVLINTHYLAEQVEDFVTVFQKNKNTIKVTLFKESKLLGSGGTINANRSFVEDEDFLICYADNFTNINISKMYLEHLKKESILTMALFKAEKPEECGIVTLDSNNVVTEFIEKPAKPSSNLANAGVYIADRRFFDFFPNCDQFDLGKDVLPKLKGIAYGWPIEGRLIDIGTIDNYYKAQKIVL